MRAPALLNLAKIKLALGATSSWPRMRLAVRRLTNPELEAAESFERLGGRRENILKVLRAERYRRGPGTRKMLRLKVEANL